MKKIKLYLWTSSLIGYSKLFDYKNKLNANHPIMRIAGFCTSLELQCDRVYVAQMLSISRIPFY